MSNSNPDNNPAASWAITGEVYKMELDGKILGKFGKAGKRLGEFSTIHEIDCRNPEQLLRLRDLGLACAEDSAQRETGAANRPPVGRHFTAA